MGAQIKKSTEKIYIDDICTDVLLQIIMELDNSNIHFGEGLGLTGSNINGKSFNEYFDKQSFIARPLQKRAKEVISNYKSKKYNDANKHLVQLEQRTKILESLMPFIVPEDTVTDEIGIILPMLHQYPKHVRNMRQELQPHLRTAMRSNAVGEKRVAFAQDMHFNPVVRGNGIMKKRRIESKTDSARGDDGDKLDTTPILTEATSSGLDATLILDPSSTPVLDNQSSSHEEPEATPILGSNSTPILHDQSYSEVDPEATPILGSNSTPTMGGTTSTNMNPEATSTSGSTFAISNNEQAEIDDLLNSVFAPRSCSYQSRKPDINPTVPTKQLLSRVVGDMNSGRRGGSFVDHYFIARYLTLIVPKMWLQEVNGSKPNLEKTMDGDISKDSVERIWNNGNFILKRLKSGVSPVGAQC